MMTASVTLANSSGLAGRSRRRGNTDDAPPVMTADNWNVTDFYMIAAQLHAHKGSRQMSGQKTGVIEQNTRGDVADAGWKSARVSTLRG